MLYHPISNSIFFFIFILAATVPNSRERSRLPVERETEPMGNCQAVDAASLIIQHPAGKIDRLYWPVNAGEIMKSNPGHYVALLISSEICSSETSDLHCRRRDNHRQTNSTNSNSVRLTRIKLLKPTDSLVLGQIYRLVKTQGLFNPSISCSVQLIPLICELGS